MTRVIAICNQKGGVGKTTTAMNLSAYLAMMGERTLLIDFDPQFNATVGLGVKHEPHETVYHALLAGRHPKECIKQTSLANLHLSPASEDLAGALVEFVNTEEREFHLRKFVDSVRGDYDFIFIDLPPSLNLLTLNGLLASDEVVIPVQCEYYSLEGLSQLLRTIELVNDHMSHSLKIAGALLTMYDKREKLSREVAKEVRRRFPYNVFNIEIPRSVSLAEAPSFQKPIMLFAPQSPGAIAYEILAKEIRQEVPSKESGVVRRDPQNYEAYPIPKTKELDGIKRIVETIKEEYAPTEEAVEAREEEIQKEAIQEPEGRPTFADTLRIIQENQLTEEKIQDEIEDILQSVQPKEEKEEVFQEEESPSPKILFFFES